LARQLPDADFGAPKNSALSGRLRRSQPMTRRVRRTREPFVWKGRCQVEQFKELQHLNGGFIHIIGNCAAVFPAEVTFLVET